MKRLENIIIRYCVSVNQKGLMTGCVYRRKKMCIDVFDVCMDGRDANKMIAQTDAYLAILSGNLN